MIAESMARIKAALRDQLPELERSWRPPAALEAIVEAEQALGVRLPDEVRQLYGLHDGQEEDGPGLFFGLPFLPLEQMVAEWQSWASLADEYADEGWHYSVPAGWIQERYIHLPWVPISKDWGGNHLGVDMGPGEHGVTGQMINFGRDEETKYVIAESLGELLQWIAHEAEAGNYTISRDEGDVSWSHGQQGELHFLDALKQLPLPLLRPAAVSRTVTAPEVWLEGLDESWQSRIRRSFGTAEKFLSGIELQFVRQGLVDITPVTYCANVRKLVLSANEIHQLPSLHRCVQLKDLYIGGNPLSDIAPLQDLPRLQALHMGNTEVRDFTPLCRISSLRKLSASLVQAEDIKGIAQLSQLTELELDGKGLLEAGQAAASLGQLQGLVRLKLANMYLPELSFLSGCRQLRELVLVNVSVADISALATMPGLHTVELQGSNEVGRLEALAQSESLKRFSGSFEQFELLSALVGNRVDFSKLVGDMTAEQRDRWREYNRSQR